uniref:F-box/LRR-repeat protein 4 n=1 Tax=Panagrellus redivivus TaxID=6233 RepID=A0A7E4UYC4_PANRE
MPFPLQALDYGSRCRLRELVTPAEAYDFQLAAPHFDGLNPIQKVHDRLLVYTRVYLNDNVQLCAKAFPAKNLNTDELYIIKRELIIAKFAANHSAQLITDRFITSLECLTFRNCDLTAKFLQDLSIKTKNDVQRLTIQQCTLNDDVTLDFVCLLFKKLKSLCVSDNYFLKRTWIDTFVLHQFTNMAMIKIDGASIDLLKVEETQLINFMKAQSETFSIYITLQDNCDSKEVQQILSNLFGNRFWHLEKKDIFIGRKFAIGWQSSEERHQQYYILREDELNHERATEENAKSKPFSN